MTEILEPAFRFGADEPSKGTWRKVTFGEVARCMNESETNPQAKGLNRVVGLEHIDPEDLRIKRWADIEDGTSFSRVFRAGQVLFGKRRAYQRKVALADFDGICSGDILVFEARTDVLLPELLPFLTQTEGFFQHALGTSAGSLSPRTKWSEMAGYEFLLPPMEEQRRIADILWAAEDQIAVYKNVQAALATVQEKTFLAMLHGGWAKLPCDELLDGKPRNGLSPDNSGKGVECLSLSIGCIRNEKVVIEGNTKVNHFAAEQVGNFSLRKNDVLVVRGNGNKNLAGRCGLVADDLNDYVYPDLLIRLRFNENLIRTRFAVLQWNTETVHAELLKKAKSSNGIWKINGKDIGSHCLFAPPIEKQDAFLTEMDLHHSAKVAAKNALNDTRALRASLSRCLFAQRK